MAPLLPAPKARSSPSLTLTHYSTSPNLSDDARLIPRPLSTRASRANLSSKVSQLGKYGYHAASPKEYSQKVVHSYSLGSRPKTERSQEERETFYTCTLCFYPLPPKTTPYLLPTSITTSNSPTSDGSRRIFCKDCWIWIYDLSICWTCGEIVGRLEERVGFGWCWWHWGCLGCLICKVCNRTSPSIVILFWSFLIHLQTPLKPPPWTEDRTGIELIAPPICDHCVDDWEVAEDAASSSKTPRSDLKEKLRVRTEDLNHASSDILHEMRKAGHVDCYPSTLKHESTTARKRSRPDDKFTSEIDTPKRQKNPRLTDISEKGAYDMYSLLYYRSHILIG